MDFVYEKLDVWKKAIDFGMDVTSLTAEKSIEKEMMPVLDAIAKRAITVSTAIAKGKGYASKDDFAQHLYLSRGSVYETMSLMELLKKKNIISGDQYTEFANKGNKVAAMLSGLIKAIYKPAEKQEDQKLRG